MPGDMLDLGSDERYSTGILLARSLAAAQIPRCFGIPGVQNLRIYETLGNDTVEPVLVTNEVSAAYLAVGQYQSSGLLGCANLIGGPGLTHALPGIEFAFRTHAPVLVLTTGCARDEGRSYQLHDVDNLEILAPLCKETHRLSAHDDVHEVVSRLVASALGGVPGPCALEVPMHLLKHSALLRVPGEAERSVARTALAVPSNELPSDLPESLAATLVACANAIGRTGLYVTSDRGHHRVPFRRSAVPLALGAAFSEKLAVAITDIESLLAFAPELTLATQRRLPLVVFAERDPNKVAELELVAQFAGVHVLRGTDASLQASELITALQTPQVVVCMVDLPAPRVGAPAPVEVTDAWLSAFSEGVRGSGPVFVAADDALAPVVARLAADGTTTHTVYHDQSLGFVADGAARTSKQPAVVVIHEAWAMSAALSGLGESHLDQTPVVLLVLASSTAPPCLRALQQLTKSTSILASVAEMPAAIKAASILSESSPPGPICVICPFDLARESGQNRATDGSLTPTRTAPPEPAIAVLDEVANMFIRARQPLLFVGRGAKDAAPELIELAHRTGAVVASTLSGKGVYPETDPLWLWASLGPLSPPPMHAIAETCDGALILGARLSELGSAHFRARFPKNCFHVDIDPSVPNRSVASVPVVADAATFVRALLRHIESHKRGLLPRDNDAPIRALASAHRWVADDLHARTGSRSEGALDPYRLIQTVQESLPTDTIFCTDSGNSTIHALEALRLACPERFLCPADYNSMGFSVPAALGAAWSNPSRTVVSFVGDGAFLMTGLKSLVGEPSAPPILVIVLRDRRLGMIGDIQRVTHRAEVCTKLPEFHLEALRLRPSRLHFATVSTQAALAANLEDARRHLAAGRSSVIECLVDPERTSYFFRGALSSSALPPPRASAVAPADDAPSGDLWSVLERAGTEFADRPAIHDGDRHYTYGDLHERALKLARFLRDQGVGPGEAVGVMLRNRAEVIETHFALAALRAVVLNVNVRLAPPELNHIFRQSGARWIVTTPDFAPALSAAAALGDLRLGGVLWVDDPAAQSPPTSGDARLGEHHRYSAVMTAAPTPFAPARGSEYDPAHLYYTSGTTGLPKGVVLTHRQVFVHAIAAAEEMRITQDDTWGHFSAMYHVVDAFAIYALTWHGGQHVIVSDPDPTRFLRLLASERITCTNLAAAAAHFLIHSPDVGSHDFSALRIVSCGGSALDPGTVKRLMEILGCELFMSYGMTECCGKISMSLLSEAHKALSPDERFTLIATSGRPFKRIQVRLVDDHGADVEANDRAVGEVWIRGITVFAGYHNDGPATREAFQDGWFKTGDLATIRPDGYLTIVGRKKDMIIAYGENVYPGEVERVLRLHPGVQQAAVYGLPHPTAGESVKAVVQRRAGHEVPASDLTAFCRRHLAAYKVPAIIEFIAEMPMSGTFKIDKLSLKSRDTQGSAPPAGSAPSVATARSRPQLGLQDCVDRVTRIIAGISDADPTTLPLTATLWNLGLDSILFLTLLRELESGFELKLDPNFLVQNNTIETIAARIADALVKPQGEPPRRPQTAPLLNSAALNSWQTTVRRPLGGFEAVVYQSNRRGTLHVNPVLEVEGHIEPERMRAAAALLEQRFPYLAATMREAKGEFVLEYHPERHLELLFLSAHEAEPLDRTLAAHLVDGTRKKLLFIRSNGADEVYQIAPAIWHCYLEVHGFLRLIQELLEIYEQLSDGAPVDTSPRPLPIAREDLFARLHASGVAPLKPLPAEILAKTGQEVTPALEVFRVNKFKAPFGTQPKRDRGVSFAGEYRDLTLSGEETRSVLAAASRQQSSLTGALSAALCLVARDLLCPAPRTHRLLLVGSFDARPLLNLPADAMGYYATYPKFLVDIAPSTEFWDLARHFHAVNQDYIENRTYAGMSPEYFQKIARGFGSVAKLLWIPGMWEMFTAPGRLFAVNLGVIEPRIGRFSVRGVKVLQDIPSLTIYSYVLGSRLHLLMCSQLPPDAADQFADRVAEQVRRLAQAQAAQPLRSPP